MVARPSAERHVVPRWRSVARTVEAGEFRRLAERRPLLPNQSEELDRLERVWQLEQSDIAASEFVTSALVAGLADRAKDAATQLQDAASPVLSSFASRALNAPVALSKAEETDELNHHRFFKEIQRTKSRLRLNPRSALAWADLARRYTILGQLDKADQSLRIALAIAPYSRYLLRIRTKFLVHTDRPRDALHLLERSPRTIDDPWLTAARLSVEIGSGRSPHGMKAARRLSENLSFHDIERSELKSELGTLELRSGQDKRAKKLFRSAVEVPTDNALAQVIWASEHLRALERPNPSSVPFASEAMCRQAGQSGDWTAAVRFSLSWLDDQPFDAEAAMFGSFYALVGLEAWTKGREIAALGLQTNPQNATLRNNHAFALAQLGDLEKAKDELRSARQLAGRSENVAILATEGLIAFRSGDPAEGRIRYQTAIDLACRQKQGDQEAMAQAMLTQEELRAGLNIDANAARIITDLMDTVAQPGVTAVMQRTLGKLPAAVKNG